MSTQVFSSLAEIFSVASFFCQSETVSMWSEKFWQKVQRRNLFLNTYTWSKLLCSSPALPYASSVRPVSATCPLVAWGKVFPFLRRGDACLKICRMINYSSEANSATLYNRGNAEKGLGQHIVKRSHNKKEIMYFQKVHPWFYISAPKNYTMHYKTAIYDKCLDLKRSNSAY